MIFYSIELPPCCRLGGAVEDAFSGEEADRDGAGDVDVGQLEAHVLGGVLGRFGEGLREGEEVRLFALPLGDLLEVERDGAPRREEPDPLDDSVAVERDSGPVARRVEDDILLKVAAEVSQ